MWCRYDPDECLGNSENVNTTDTIVRFINTKKTIKLFYVLSNVEVCRNAYEIAQLVSIIKYFVKNV